MRPVPYFFKDETREGAILPQVPPLEYLAGDHTPLNSSMELPLSQRSNPRLSTFHHQQSQGP